MATNNAINHLNFPNVTSVNSATVLTASAYGTEVICTGAAAYALTLPAVASNANKFIDIFSQTTSNAIVTITPASGTIAGQSTLAIGSGDGVRVMNDGTNWWVLDCWLQPVNFRATRSAVQSINDGSITKVAYNATSFNIGNYFDTVTNNRFSPLLPGKYYFSQSIKFELKAANPLVECAFIYFNGNAISQSVRSLTINNEQQTLEDSILFRLNGSTDFIEGYCYKSSGSGALNLEATATNQSTTLMGYRVSLF